MYLDHPIISDVHKSNCYQASNHREYLSKMMINTHKIIMTDDLINNSFSGWLKTLI